MIIYYVIVKDNIDIVVLDKTIIVAIYSYEEIRILDEKLRPNQISYIVIDILVVVVAKDT